MTCEYCSDFSKMDRDYLSWRKTSANTEPVRYDNGIYVYVDLMDDVAQSLVDYQVENDIPNPIVYTDFHVSLIATPSPISWISRQSLNEVCEVLALEKWNFGKDKFCLVLTLRNQYLEKRHGHALIVGATHDYSSYKPHIALSYDIPEDFDTTRMALPSFPIVLKNERTRPFGH